MSLLGGIGAIAGDTAGSAANFAMNARLMEKGQNYNTDMFSRRYQMTVQDLKNAGLNPMLAYMNGAGGQPSSSAASVTPSRMGSDAVAAENATKITSAQEALIRAQTRKTKAEETSIRQNIGISTPIEQIMHAVQSVVEGYTINKAERQKRFSAFGSDVRKGAESAVGWIKGKIQDLRDNHKAVREKRRGLK